ncbi:FAD-dependent oxidoreductase [Nonomuraea sp. SMC257]|uniref:FAD-dependent oxidoreductase n=1 Tax=Nonomuraea montanisoli TaxID=2741721 RepID=A0A7Y6I8P5_9ACTN|nr:FAD-dependent oxidoreductase [Nonomuraea montanisoli]NUW33733.1 FAD-dependent oxidoreductase [Nonomuraea montanisoli]
MTPDRPQVVIVGAGDAGYQAARTLSRKVGDGAEIVLVNPTGVAQHRELLPQVMTGVLSPERVSVPLAGTLPGVRVVLGTVTHIDAHARRVLYDGGVLDYDRLIVAVGGVSEVAQISALSSHSVGFHTVDQALHLRDHIHRQLSAAAASTDPFERATRCTFVVLGAGYAGIAAASAGQSLCQSIACRDPRLREQPIRWILADPAEWLLPDMRHRLSRTTARTLRSRGVEVRTRTSVGQVTTRGLRLTDGEFIPTRTIVWSFGVRPDPLVTNLGLPAEQGRIRVDEHLAVPGHPEIYACGDASAVPDLTRTGKLTPMSSRHAVRQGMLAGGNVAASLGYGSRRPYQHRIRDSIADLIPTSERPLSMA